MAAGKQAPARTPGARCDVWKLIGFFVGLFSKGPLGALLGLLAGWWLDSRIARLRGAAPRDGFVSGLFSGRSQRVFQQALFGCLGHLAKADGRVTQREIEIAEQLMLQLRLNAQQRRAAIGQFRRGKQDDYPLEDELAPFAAMTGNMQHLRRLFIEILLNGALSDGVVSDAERRVLARVARVLRIGAEELDRLLGARRGPAQAHATEDADPYEVLGVPRDADVARIKKAYRQLMSQYHPDKLAGSDVPATMRDYAHRRVREVRSAYDALRRERGFR
jgi:DnaJ like chaperone protein